MILVDHGQQIKALKEKAKHYITHSNFFSIRSYCIMNYIELPLQEVTKKEVQASGTSNEYGIAIRKTIDNIYGILNTFHIDVLRDIFEEDI